MPQPKYPHIVVSLDLSGPDGNAFAILGKVRNQMRESGISEEEVESFFEEATSGDYDHLLSTCRRWIAFHGSAY